MNHLIRFLFALVLFSPLTSSAQDLKSISDYVWSWTGPGISQQVRFQSDGALLFKGGAKGAWKAVSPSTIEARMEPGGVKQLKFSADFSSYAEVGATNSPIAGVRERLVPELSQKTGSTAPVATVAPPKATPGTDFQGMILDPDWLPERLGVDQKFTADLRFFSERVLAGEPQGGATKPTVIHGKLQWLMPISQAIESFGNVTKKPVVKITNQSFPHHSLTVHGLQGRFEDLGYPFNLVHLIADANGQLISVQYVAQAPKKMTWIAGTPVEEKLPYYDFINVKKNGSTTNAVSFQMISSSPGTKLIKMVLHKRAQMQMPVIIPGQPFLQPVVDQTLLYGKWLEDSHWYLPCPLAARLIDIANKALK